MLTQGEAVEAHALRSRGWSVSAIARHLGRDRKTIRGYLAGSRVPGSGSRAGPGRLAPVAEYCRIRFAGGLYRSRIRRMDCDLRLGRPGMCARIAVHDSSPALPDRDPRVRLGGLAGAGAGVQGRGDPDAAARGGGAAASGHRARAGLGRPGGPVRAGPAPQQRSGPSAPTGCSSTTNGTCGRPSESTPAITTVTARTSLASNGRPTTTPKSSRRSMHPCSAGKYSAA